MESFNYSINTLFDQLGLADSDEAIEIFISTHQPLAKNTRLHEASFWTASQAEFLQQAIDEDANWAYYVDQLDTQLR